MKAETNNSKSNSRNLNLIWWILTFALLAAGIFGNYYFASIAWPIRLAGLILLAGVVVLMIFQTTAGKKIFRFAKEAKIELNKVVWPTRQETIKTTAIIVGLVVFTAIILWGIDSMLLWLINWLTGRG